MAGFRVFMAFSVLNLARLERKLLKLANIVNGHGRSDPYPTLLCMIGNIILKLTYKEPFLTGFRVLLEH